MAIHEGFYAFFYTGRAGSGTMLVCLKGGRIVGVDVLGGKVEGTYEDAGTGLTAELNFELAAGDLATGQTLAEPTQLPSRLELPETVFHGDIIRIDIGTGPLNVRAQFVAAPL